MYEQSATFECELAEKDAQIVALREALSSIQKKLQSASDYRIHETLAITATALSTPPPPVVPMEDVKPLVEALRSSYDVTEWPADGSSKQERALATFTTKHPIE